MNPFPLQSHKRDYEMAMGGGGFPDMSMMQGQASSFQGGAQGPQSFYFPPNNGLPINPQMMGMQPFNSGQMPNGMPMPPFDGRSMPFMPPQFFNGAALPTAPSVKSETMSKSNADWALEKRRARNRITAAESRRKCKEEIQNLRDELARLKEEKKEKEELIDYYRNRYENFEKTGDSKDGNSSTEVLVKVCAASNKDPVLKETEGAAASEEKAQSACTTIESSDPIRSPITADGSLLSEDEHAEEQS